MNAQCTHTGRWHQLNVRELVIPKEEEDPFQADIDRKQLNCMRHLASYLLIASTCISQRF